ncbi:type II secretion system minor pseudopilin GspJ [Methylophilus sp. 3sh_L]|uniref:type II secretion system minor pseudopilin GspJ n=1 Tax=Methylophilus sp. 3sh_L TaxID=3377114 RepID=UPI00398EDBB0
MSYRTSLGLTLIELVIAIAILQILGLLSYRALAEVIHSNERLDSEFTRWRSISHSIQHIDTELQQVIGTSRKIDAKDKPTPQATMTLVRNDFGNQELHFQRLDNNQGSIRVSYRIRQGNLEWLRWNSLESGNMPKVDVLLENVARINWQFINNGERLANWPPSSSTSQIPDGVLIKLELPDQGTITRMVALR